MAQGVHSLESSSRGSRAGNALELATALIKGKTPRLTILIFSDTALGQGEARLFVVRPSGRSLSLASALASTPLRVWQWSLGWMRGRRRRSRLWQGQQVEEHLRACAQGHKLIIQRAAGPRGGLNLTHQVMREKLKKLAVSSKNLAQRHCVMIRRGGLAASGRRCSRPRSPGLCTKQDGPAPSRATSGPRPDGVGGRCSHCNGARRSWWQA